MTERANADAGQPPAEWRMSEDTPYEVDWVDLAAVPGLRGVAGAVAVPGLRGVAERDGALGMGFAPGKYDSRGKHDRDLAADLERLRAVHRVDALLLLVDDGELATMRIPELPAAVAAVGITVLRHPIPDFGVPQDAVAFAATIDDVLARIRAGERVLVACFGGFGRTGTVSACVLRVAGLAPADAIALVRATRPGTIERDSQVAFVEAYSA